MLDVYCKESPDKIETSRSSGKKRGKIAINKAKNLSE